MFDMAEAGDGTLEIIRTLNNEGIASPRGKLWARTSVHNILTNEAYTGTLVWGINAKDNADPVRVEKAFPAIITRAQLQRVGRHLSSRAPKFSHPRRVGSSYLLSGLLKCEACKTPLTGRFAKSGQYSYYVCQSNINFGKDACGTPTLNARRFEELVVARIRSDILTEGSIRDLVKVVDEEMGGVAREQRKRLKTIEDELQDVKRQLDRIWRYIATSDTVMDDASTPHQGTPGPAGALGGCGGGCQGDALSAPQGPRRREYDYGLCQGDERLPQRERADRTQGLHQVLRQGDRRHARRRPPALYHSYAR